MKKAFSLVELLIAIGIIAVMSSVLFVSLNGSKNIKQVEVAGRQLAAAIRQAQNYALSGKGDPANTSRKICGYGIYFADGGSQYQPFYNYTNSAGDCAAISKNYNVAAPTFASPAQALPDSVLISTIFSTDAFYFTIPFADTNYNGGALGTQKISLQKNSAKYTVCVYGRGNVTEKAGDATCP